MIYLRLAGHFALWADGGFPSLNLPLLDVTFLGLPPWHLHANLGLATSVLLLRTNNQIGRANHLALVAPR
jgi:hypothetical protein